MTVVLLSPQPLIVASLSSRAARNNRVTEPRTRRYRYTFEPCRKPWHSSGMPAEAHSTEALSAPKHPPTLILPQSMILPSTSSLHGLPFTPTCAKLRSRAS